MQFAPNIQGDSSSDLVEEKLDLDHVIQAGYH